jgi:hypothetical protein
VDDGNRFYTLKECSEVNWGGYSPDIPIEDGNDILDVEVTDPGAPEFIIDNISVSLTVGLNQNSNGSITFYLTFLDEAGNWFQDVRIHRLGEWAIVKDGLVYGERGVSSSTRTLTDDPNIWDSAVILRQEPYSFEPTLVDITDKVLLGGNNTTTNLLRFLERYSENYSFKAARFPGVFLESVYSELIAAYENKKDTLFNSSERLVSENLTDRLSTYTSPTFNDYCINPDQTMTVNESEEFELSVEYKLSTGYSPYDPIFESNHFDLIDVVTNDIGDPIPGGDLYERIYRFVPLQSNLCSIIDIGTEKTPEERTSTEFGITVNPSTGESSDIYIIKNTDVNLSIEEGFICDGKGLITSTGNITIHPDFVNEDPQDACIILANGNIIIENGTDKTGLPVDYDIIQAFLIAGGEIVIEMEDEVTSNLNGILIEGGLTAFTPITESSAIVNKRKISIDYRNNYPALAVKHNPKYGLLSTDLFGTQTTMYQIDIGFKPY